MPYGQSKALPGEAAAKLGHISVLNDPLVKQMLEEFQRLGGGESGPPQLDGDVASVTDVPPLEFVIAIDGSVSAVPNTLVKHKMLTYVKVAALGMSLRELARLQVPIVNPDLVNKLLQDGADTFSTVLPLSNVTLPGRTLGESIRAVLQATFEEILGGQLYETLGYLVSREWLESYEMSAHFSCPRCSTDVRVPRSKPSFSCDGCGNALTLVDYLELTTGLSEEGNDERIGIDLMVVLENLLTMHYLKTLVEEDLARRTLVMKDGPLMLARQYSRLVDPFREYISYLNESGKQFYLVGIEKQQAFVTHAPVIDASLEIDRLFVPSNKYVLTFIKSGGPDTSYGERVLYGTKAYYRLDSRSTLVLNLPYGLYQQDVQASDIIGLDEILATLRRLGSRQFQNALLPIVAANHLASLSVYPSNRILERFAEAAIAADA